MDNSRLDVNPEKNIVIFTGNFGSGKTETAVNFALKHAEERNDISIADLDIVNPYFRCREAREPMEQAGIKVVTPEGEYNWADLPIILPEIRGMIKRSTGLTIFDVGGDDVGAKVLSSFADVLQADSYELNIVLNINRPFTETVEGCLKMMKEIETASNLKITGIVSNSHLIENTNIDIVLAGLSLVQSVEKETGVPVRFVSVSEDVFETAKNKIKDVPLLKIKRLMTPPWLNTNVKLRKHKLQI